MGTVSSDASWSIPKKKVKKLKKHHFGFISSKTGLGHAKKELKKISFQGPFLLDPGWSIPKKIEKYSTNFFLKKRHFTFNF